MRSQNRQPDKYRTCAVTLVLLSGIAPATAATLEFVPYASAQLLHESNVYRFSQQVADVTGTTDTADRIERYAAGLETSYAWTQQQLRATVEARLLRFDELAELDHDEHLLEMGYAGTLFANTRVDLAVRNERRMASFEDRRSTDLVIERDRELRGDLRFALRPNWHLLSGTRQRHLRSPLPDAPALLLPAPGAPARAASPDFAVRESAYSIGLEFGIESKDHPEAEAPLLLGLKLQQQNIDFSGLSPQPQPPPGVEPENFDGYDLLSLETTVQYTISGLSSLGGAFGVTQYTPDGGERSSPELTGNLGYTRKLSALTEVEASLYQRIVLASGTADSTTDTGFGLGIKWEPLLDFMVVANYSRARSDFNGRSGVAPENSGRGDTVQNASLSLAYPVRHFFGLRVFGTTSKRSSNLAFQNYRNDTVGIELSLRWE
ncbi:surface lipoprotein assembly modifier [Sinimarinibacterium flocculans]|uniref:surface lipoprotein assembly modifier n=1 Tax=Sinimarinibacterium flocculans TaxID=985250 RepID=UPI002492D0F2|nr:surface lipoprotein assembly modifier [Sinimarinibacterium flocculans]